MPRRALRPSFVATFALGAAAMASGCGSKGSANVGNVDGSISDGGCPADVPTSGAPCDVPSSVMCNYQGGCNYLATCNGMWVVILGSGGCSMNPPAPMSEAGPDVYDAAPDVYEGGPDVHDGAPDGESQDGGHD
jgi:hypothetical protein